MSNRTLGRLCRPRKTRVSGRPPRATFTLTLVEFRRLLETEHNVSNPTLMHYRQQIKAFFQQLVMQSAGASYVQPHAGDEMHREYLEISYEKRRCSCIALSDIAATKSYCCLWKSTTYHIAICANISADSHVRHAYYR